MPALDAYAAPRAPPGWGGRGSSSDLSGSLASLGLPPSPDSTLLAEESPLVSSAAADSLEAGSGGPFLAGGFSAALTPLPHGHHLALPGALLLEQVHALLPQLAGGGLTCGAPADAGALDLAQLQQLLALQGALGGGGAAAHGNPCTGALSNPLYKTELCRSWEEFGSCRYGAKCQFAHTRGELRPVQRHPKYKTEVCRTFAASRCCPYGTRCRFIHQSPALVELHGAAAAAPPPPAAFAPGPGRGVAAAADTGASLAAALGGLGLGARPALRSGEPPFAPVGAPPVRSLPLPAPTAPAARAPPTTPRAPRALGLASAPGTPTGAHPGTGFSRRSAADGALVAATTPTAANRRLPIFARISEEGPAGGGAAGAGAGAGSGPPKE